MYTIPVAYPDLELRGEEEGRFFCHFFFFFFKPKIRGNPGPPKHFLQIRHCILLVRKYPSIIRNKPGHDKSFPKVLGGCVRKISQNLKLSGFEIPHDKLMIFLQSHTLQKWLHCFFSKFLASLDHGLCLSPLICTQEMPSHFLDGSLILFFTSRFH